MAQPTTVTLASLPDADRAAALLVDRLGVDGGHDLLARCRRPAGPPGPLDDFTEDFARRLADVRRELEQAVAACRDLASDPATGPFVERVAAGSRRFERLATRLVEYADAGRPPDLVDVSVAQVCALAVDDLAEQAGVGVPTVAETAGPAVPADAELLRLLVRHLLANAAAYGGPGPVRVLTSRDAEGWELRVVDHGIGCPTEDRLRVLRPLVRLDRDRAVPGDGMGLAVCARVAAGHGGAMRVNRTPRGGATIRVVCPIR